MLRILAALACLLHVLPVPAGDLRPLPPLLGTLSDEVGVMSIDESRKLAGALERTLDETGIRVVVVIAETAQPGSIEDYGDRLARRWKSERGLDIDHSIFIVLAVRDRELQVMPGRGLARIERELQRSGKIAELAPLFRAGRFFDALMELKSEIDRMLRAKDGVT